MLWLEHICDSCDSQKTLETWKEDQKEHFTICSILRDLRLFKIMIIKKEHEQKTGRNYWILWQLCEICQKSEGWRKSNTSPWAQQLILFQFWSHRISLALTSGCMTCMGVHEYSILMESCLWVAMAHKQKFARLQVPYINGSQIMHRRYERTG